MPEEKQTIEDVLKKRLASIKTLPPEKRAEAIKELEAELHRLEKERREEIKEAAELAERTETEIEAIRKIMPEEKAVEIDGLFAKPPEHLEEKVKAAPELAEKAAKPYASPFEELKTEFYSFIDKQDKIKGLRERAARGDITPGEHFAIETYLHEAGAISPMAKYVSEDAREKFLNEEKELKKIANYMGHKL